MIDSTTWISTTAKALAPTACYSNACVFSPKPISGILQGVRAMTVACMANSTLKCKLMGLQTAVTFCYEKKKKN